MTMPFDTLKLARRLEGAGFSHQQAGDMADGIAEALSALVTKADLKADLAATKADLQAELSELRNELRLREQRMTIRLGGMMVVAVGVVVTAIKFLH